MLETPHALVGAAIVAKIPNPVVSIPLAFASHFILDMVPHWNPHLNTELKKFGRISQNSTIIILADVAVSLLLVSFVAGTSSQSTAHALTIYLGAGAAILPDLLEAPYYFLRLGAESKLAKNWIAFQKSIQVDTTIVPGLTTQIATILAALWWAFS